MGWVYAPDIKKAADYLLGVLSRDSEVRYSRFYDGEDETHDGLIKAMGYPEEGEDFEPDCPELLIDLAAWALKEQGFVETTELEDELADGEPDYRIALTEEGARKLAGGQRPVFRDLDL